MERRKKSGRTLLIWLAISVVLQFGLYSFMNNKVQAAFFTGQTGNKKPVTQSLTADIPGTGLKDIQLSYGKDYVAYKEGAELKVYNLIQKKVVFSKAPPAGSDKGMGVLNYEWLPDRNALIYFYARKNPNPVTYTKEEVPTQTSQVTPESGAKLSRELPKTEDLNQAADKKPAELKQTGKTTLSAQAQDTPNKGAAASPTKTKVVAHQGNPQLTDLYTLNLPESSDASTLPDDHFDKTLEEFPAGGEIEQMEFSTFTNLMYVTVKTGSATKLYEITVMMEIQTLSKSGETILNMAASDHFGTLYIETKTGGKKEIVALGTADEQQRTIISQNPAYTLLGERNGQVYVGEIKNSSLINIFRFKETDPVKAEPEIQKVWTGSISFESALVRIGSNNELIIDNSGTVYVVSDGQLKTTDLRDSATYISSNGAELVQMTEEGDKTHFVLKPLVS